MLVESYISNGVVLYLFMHYFIYFILFYCLYDKELKKKKKSDKKILDSGVFKMPSSVRYSREVAKIFCTVKKLDRC